MNRIVLPFDKENILEEEIKEHIDWYVANAEKGMKLVEVNKKEAMEILREVNNNLKEESSYYEKKKLSNILDNENELKSRYSKAIFNSYVHQSRRTSYDMLSNNLYDVSDYMFDIENM